MHRSLVPLAIASLAAAPVMAQQTIVSPAPASATVEGTGSNLFPWITNIVCRYMQVHSDIGGGSPKIITKIAHRRDGSAAPQNGTRTVDMEMWMGDSVDYDRISYVFANNYRSAPQLVLPRQIINLGPTSMTGSPAPFELVVPLTNPYLYVGTTSLAWEVVQYSNVVAGTMTHNLDMQGGSSSVAALPALTGAGCVATGQTATMDLGIQHIDRGGTYHFGAYVTGAPANAPTILFLGGSDPALQVPGLCSAVRTDLLVTLAVAVADASGYIRELGNTATSTNPSAALTMVLPNTFPGANLFAQAHAIDFARPDPITVCNSNGRSWVVPTPNTTIVARASRLYNFQLQGPGYPNATPLTLAHAFAAVTEFTY
jgi:hypothetical protein